MNLSLNYILLFYLFLPSSAVSKRIKHKTKETSESSALTEIDELSQHPALMKMLLITSSKKQCNCNCTKKLQVLTTEKNKLETEIVMQNRPVRYEVENNNVTNLLCPYFKNNDGFRMYKLPAVYWPRFYNMKENLKCFKLHVLKLSEQEMLENKFIYGNFTGKVNWSKIHFEIKPPEGYSRRRHFLMGSTSDRGVMRNILITYNTKGGFTLQEESPDQWLMIRNMVLLRDCMTGEVMVFTRSPQLTKTAEVIQVLQELGEEMIGKMVCDEDNNWFLGDTLE